MQIIRNRSHMLVGTHPLSTYCSLFTSYHYIHSWFWKLSRHTLTNTHADRIVTVLYISLFCKDRYVSHSFHLRESFLLLLSSFSSLWNEHFFLFFSSVLPHFFFLHGNRLLHIWLLLCLSLSALCAMLCWGPATFLLLCKVLFCCWFSWGLKGMITQQIRSCP